MAIEHPHGLGGAYIFMISMCPLSSPVTSRCRDLPSRRSESTHKVDWLAAEQVHVPKVRVAIALVFPDALVKAELVVPPTNVCNELPRADRCAGGLGTGDISCTRCAAQVQTLSREVALHHGGQRIIGGFELAVLEVYLPVAATAAGGHDANV